MLFSLNLCSWWLSSGHIPLFKNITSHMKTRLIIAVMHTTYEVLKLKPDKSSGQNGIRTHDLCGAVLYQLSYEANWELVTLWVRNIPVEGKQCKWIYERSYIWTAEKHKKTRLIIAVMHTTSAVVKLKSEKISGLNWIRTHDSAISVQCSTNWAIKLTGSWSHSEFVNL